VTQASFSYSTIIDFRSFADTLYICSSMSSGMHQPQRHRNGSNSRMSDVREGKTLTTPRAQNGLPSHRESIVAQDTVSRYIGTHAHSRYTYKHHSCDLCRQLMFSLSDMNLNHMTLIIIQKGHLEHTIPTRMSNLSFSSSYLAALERS
jgi:hypothetical protein